jgi:hypothetical protein
VRRANFLSPALVVAAVLPRGSFKMRQSNPEKHMSKTFAVVVLLVASMLAGATVAGAMGGAGGGGGGAGGGGGGGANAATGGTSTQDSGYNAPAETAHTRKKVRSQ